MKKRVIGLVMVMLMSSLFFSLPTHAEDGIPGELTSTEIAEFKTAFETALNANEPIQDELNQLKTVMTADVTKAFEDILTQVNATSESEPLLELQANAAKISTGTVNLGTMLNALPSTNLDVAETKVILEIVEAIQNFQPKLVEINAAIIEKVQANAQTAQDSADALNAPKETVTTTGTGEAAATAVKLPNLLGTDDPNVVIGRIIKFIVGIAGSAALLMFIYGGFLWLISGGRSEYIDKGKKTMMYAIVGLIVIFSSYTAIRLILAAVGAVAQ